MTENGIFTINVKSEESFLRKKTIPFTFENGIVRNGDKVFSRREMNALISHMSKIMRKSNGVGLSANQLGLEYKVFVAQVPSSQGDNRLYAILNPELEKMSSQKETLEEGCLSVPRSYGEVPRSYQVTLRGFDKTGKPVKIKAWGFLARVFQHETDHLNGVLFLDRAKKIEQIPEE